MTHNDGLKAMRPNSRQTDLPKRKISVSGHVIPYISSPYIGFGEMEAVLGGGGGGNSGGGVPIGVLGGGENPSSGDRHASSSRSYNFYNICIGSFFVERTQSAPSMQKSLAKRRALFSLIRIL